MAIAIVATAAADLERLRLDRPLADPRRHGPPATTEAVPPSRLRRLWLRGHLTPTFAQTLAQAVHLQSLTVIGSVAGARFESGFRSLRDVRAEGADLDDHCLASPPQGAGTRSAVHQRQPVRRSYERLDRELLHTLELRGTAVDDWAIEAIGRLPRLYLRITVL